MARTSQTQKAVAEVSLHSAGKLFLGVGVREQLQIAYNDKVAITIPSVGETITGFVDSSNHVHVGLSKIQQLKEEARLTEGAQGAPAVEAEVELLREVWEDANGGAEPRRESVPHNSSQVRNW